MVTSVSELFANHPISLLAISILSAIYIWCVAKWSEDNLTKGPTRAHHPRTNRFAPSDRAGFRAFRFQDRDRRYSKRR
jgi:hypothetical protein